MKEILKNPVLYYILVPILILIWPLSVHLVYMPDTEEKWEKEKTQYVKAQKIITEILNLDPERLDFANAQNNAAQFDYTSAVDAAANQCNISSTDYKISSKPITISGGQKSQGAIVILKETDITSFAKFLSTIQLRWANLQCEKIKLTRKKGPPDLWKIDLDFKYYY